MGKSRILLISTATGYGGAERSMEILAPGLARRLGMAGREKVEREYLAGPVADRLLAALAGVIG